MGKVQAPPDYPRGITFEHIWASLKETEQIVKDVAKQQKETDRQIKETAKQQEETDRQIKETAKQQEETSQAMKETSQAMKETDRQMKEFNRRFGDLTNRFGEVVEYMIAPNLRDRFREMGLTFPKATLDTDVADFDNNIFMEIDVLLENGDKAMLVEIKTKLTTRDVKEHIKRLEKMRVYANLHSDKRMFLGAVAGVIMTPLVKNYALEQGFYVVEPSGETFTITPPKNKAKEW